MNRKTILSAVAAGAVMYIGLGIKLVTNNFQNKKDIATAEIHPQNRIVYADDKGKTINVLPIDDNKFAESLDNDTVTLPGIVPDGTKYITVKIEPGTHTLKEMGKRANAELVSAELNLSR